MKVLVPIDGSPASLRALDYAIAHYPEASLVLLNVQDIGLASELMFADWQEIAEQTAAKELKEATDKAEAAGAGFKSVMKTGPAAQTIAQIASDEEVDLIIMGTRGLGGVQVLGSVATKVIHLTDVPIMLIK